MHLRFFVSLFLLLTLLSPTAVLAFGDGKKHFQRGMKHEIAEEWDKAVEEFALAVSSNPKNPEYRLHLTRSLFNASQMYVKKGSIAAKEKNYEEAYMAFRRAYAFDPTNELARSEMERMVRLQRELNEGTPTDNKDQTGKLKMIPTSFNTDRKTATVPQIPQKLEKLRDLPFPSGVDLQFIIKELAKDLDLNVLFDNESFRQTGRKTYIDLKNVTAARALDYIFLQEGLFFQKVGPRTVIIATQDKRQKFQQLVLRTFYLSNAAPKDVAKIVQTAIPAQPGRSQTIVLTDDATNSITIRDTEENIRLIGKLISSLDKDRAEVVMEVAIYEVNKSDLMQFGNQIGTQNQLTNFGGSQSGSLLFGNNPLTTVAGAATTILSGAIPTGIILPASNIAAFQSKNNTKLVASTQIHAFNNEDSSARIGQRVPVQSAQFVTGVQNQVNNGGVVSNVINYEQIGLTLKFKPLVFPNQDVQVAMEIESKDVAGAQTLTPTFTERTIKGTARIQNNKTLLLASVAQDVESRGKAGLPLLGLIPLLGRLFTAPTRDNRQIDIVIAVTPRVIRAPAILPEDEIERPTGSLAVPTNNSLEAMVIQEEQEEMLAAARRLTNTTTVQLPDASVDAPVYVKSDTGASTGTTSATANQTTAVNTQPVTLNPILKPIDSSVKTLQLNQTADTPKATEVTFVQPILNEPTTVKTETPSDAPVVKTEMPTESVAAKTEVSTVPIVQINIGSGPPEMKVGDKIKIPVTIQGSSSFRSGVIGFRFDEKRLAVRSVTFGDVFGASLATTLATPFLNQNGKMFVSLSAKDETGATANGTLAYIEIEALAAGRHEIAFDREVLNFLTADGKNFRVSFAK
ncbi:MAG: secretin N-terminal domain-containing protein [Pyrinomonadaceae bacterium]